MKLLKLLMCSLPGVFAIKKEFLNLIDNTKLGKLQLINEIKIEPVEFPCPTHIKTRSDEPPTDVNKLHVGDIDIVAAMGDSITAGFAAEARSLTEIFIESRGVSWSIGGRDGFDTFPNIMKRYNPNLKGMSINSTNARYPGEVQGNNVAVTGSIARDMPGQAQQLLDTLGSDDKHWKHITMFIGANDLCRVCKNMKLHSPTAYINYIEEALMILSEIPRTFVSVVNVIDMSLLERFTEGLCPYLHLIECSCVTVIDEVKYIMTLYHSLVHELVNSFHDRGDFTVVVQPFLENINFKMPPQRELLSADCFHFTLLTHASAGINLWNNIIQPIGGKDNVWNVSNHITCPTEHTLLKTRNNSICF